MKASAPLFRLYYEQEYLDAYLRLTASDKKRIERAEKLIALNPRHPSLRTHKFKGARSKYPSVGGDTIFIAYASQGKGALRIIFEYGPRAGEIALHTCGLHDRAEQR